MNASIRIAAPLLKPLRTVGSMLESGAEQVSRHERGLAIAGLVLAQVLVVILYFVLVDNQTRARQAQDNAQALMQEQQRCGSQADHRARKSCLMALR